MTLKAKLTSAAVALGLGVFAAGASAAPAFFVQADIVRGHQGQPHGPVCVPNTVFFPGESLVVRAVVYDPTTGKALTADDIKNRWVHATAHIGDQSFELTYEPHPPGAPKQDLYFAHLWQIPDNFAAGSYNWSVTVTDAQGETATFEPIGSDIGLGSVNIVPPGGAPSGPPAPPAGK